MLKKWLLGMITPLVVVMLVFSLIGCDNGSGGSGKIEEPTVINGYYGVTSDGKSIEVIITPISRDVEWGATNEYVIRIDGVEKSKGTATKSGSTINFTPGDGSSVSVSNYNGGAPSVSVTKDGTTYTAQTMVTSRDYYYSVGAATGQTSTEIQQIFSGKTPEQIYNYYLKNSQYFSDYDYEEGTFDDIVAFGKYWKCPDSQLSQVSKDMNSGKVFGVGYYRHSQYGNIVFFVSKLPL